MRHDTDQPSFASALGMRVALSLLVAVAASVGYLLAAQLQGSDGPAQFGGLFIAPVVGLVLGAVHVAALTLAHAIAQEITGHWLTRFDVYAAMASALMVIGAMTLL